MSLSIGGVVEQMIREGNFLKVATNPLTQFGPKNKRYLGATLLPERPVDRNEYKEEGIMYRTIVANDSSRYSPVQIKGGVLTGSFLVRLGDQDSGSKFTGADYDTLVRLLQRSGSDIVPMSAVQTLTRWSDATLNLPLVEKIEKMRWEAMVDAVVPITGDDGFTDTVNLSNPTGHRVNASAAWSNDANDPMDDIMAMVEFLHGKGYIVSRIITGRPVISKLSLNAYIQKRVGRINVTSGVAFGTPGRASLARINEIFNEDGLPSIEEYNLQYRTSTGSGYFLKRDAMVFVCESGQEEILDLGDAQQLPVPNVLGYAAVGVAVGQTTGGRVIKVRNIDDTKPPRVEGEGWQTSFPVILQPEAIGVIKSIS